MKSKKVLTIFALEVVPLHITTQFQPRESFRVCANYAAQRYLEGTFIVWNKICMANSPMLLVNHSTGAIIAGNRTAQKLFKTSVDQRNAEELLSQKPALSRLSALIQIPKSATILQILEFFVS